MPKVITFYIRDIDKKQDVFELKGNSVLPLTSLPAKHTISAKIEGVSVRLDIDGKGKLEGAAPYCVWGDDVPVNLAVGEHVVTAIAYSDAAGTLNPSQALSIKFVVNKPVVPQPVSKMPLKGVVGLGALPADRRLALAKELGVQGCREWYTHSDRFIDLPDANYISKKFFADADWILNVDPNFVYVVTSSREVTIDAAGKITRTQARPAKDADIRKWARAYWNIWKRYGKRVIHNIGNEIDHTATKNSTSGRIYYQPDPRPTGSPYSDMEWTLKSYIDTIQKPFYEELKQLGGDDAVIAGGSITWNVANFEMACSKFDYAKYCDIGDIHRYANGVGDWTDTFTRAKKAMGGKKLMCSEWGAAHFNSSATQSVQAKLLANYDKFAENLDYTFYYMLPATPGRSVDPGLWDKASGTKQQPLWDAFAKLPNRKF